MSKEYKIAQDQLWSSKVANYTKEFPDTGKTLNRSPTKREADFVFRNYPEVTGFQTKSKASQCVQLISTGRKQELVLVLQHYVRMEWQQMALGCPWPHTFPVRPRFSSGFQKCQTRFTGFLIAYSFPQGIIILNLCLFTR